MMIRTYGNTKETHNIEEHNNIQRRTCRFGNPNICTYAFRCMLPLEGPSTVS